MCARMGAVRFPIGVIIFRLKPSLPLLLHYFRLDSRNIFLQISLPAQVKEFPVWESWITWRLFFVLVRLTGELHYQLYWIGFSLHLEFSKISIDYWVDSFLYDNWCSVRETAENIAFRYMYSFVCRAAFTPETDDEPNDDRTETTTDDD